MLEDAAQLNIVLGRMPLCATTLKEERARNLILESDDSSMVICRLQLALAIQKPNVKARADAIPQSKFPVFLG